LCIGLVCRRDRGCAAQTVPGG